MKKNTRKPMSAAARKRISEGMKRRYAALKEGAGPIHLQKLVERTVAAKPKTVVISQGGKGAVIYSDGSLVEVEVIKI